uniref:DUF659 domain-containing protein n=1 Tax=Gossypium raimondii TaxID=29730 RepID=A0A0D2QPN9_GOSRA|nr:hypothetical protein B456_001G125800 [Gossypium raimondii]
MPPREEFSTKGLEGAPCNDIGWHFGTQVPNAKGNIVCKLCGKVVKGGITQFKEHIAHKIGNVAPCPNVTGVIRESMMNIVKESNTKKIDKKRRKNEFLSQLIEEEDVHEEFIDEVSVISQSTRESIQSQHEWYRREEFKRSTGGWDNIYEEGRSSHGSAREYHRERTSKSIPTSSPWLYNLIQVSTEVGQGVKLPTPYEVSDVYLESEYQRVRDWVNGLKTHWKELGATLICDGWTNSLNQMHIINFLVYCSKGTIFWKSVDVSNLCLEDIGKKPSVAKVLDEAKKMTCFIYNHIWTVDLMKKYTQGKQILRPALTRFATHFIQLDEITRQKQANVVQESLSEKGKEKRRIRVGGVTVLIETLEGTRSIIERLEHSLDTQVRMVNQLHEKENLLLDGENVEVLPVDTSNDEMNVNQSQQ